MHRFLGVLLSLLICCDYAAGEDTLFDRIRPNANIRIFDTLSAAVEAAYEGKRKQNDWSDTITFGEKPISIPMKNDRYKAVLYDGDMLLSPGQLQKIADNAIGGRQKREAYLDEFYPSTIWQEGVPYELHSSLSLVARLSVLRAIRFWAAHTCIKFRPRTKESFFLRFVGYESGCWSAVGRDDTEPIQIVSIGRGCEHFGVTSHELAHALGVFHEQSRYDRDKFVTLNSRAVDRDILYNFAKIGPHELSTYQLPYDVGSVMHYAPTEFPKIRNVAALSAVDPFLQQSMGSMDKPTFLDVLALNIHYRCTEQCPKLACVNGGYTDPNNCAQCKCPDGYGGQLCDTVAASFSPNCGGVIEVAETVRKFEILIVQTGNTLKDKVCVYQLRAPAGKKILLNLLRVSGKCIEGCYVDGVEAKMRKDKRPVGYRFCCSESQLKRLVSDSNEVPLMVYSRNGRVQTTFEYTYVDANAAHDAPELTPSDWERVDNTSYDAITEQKSARLGLFATISEPRRK